MSSHRQIEVFDEPALEFRYGQAVADPRDGLSIFGPYDADRPGQPKNLSYAVVGTQAGISAFAAWVQCVQGPIVSAGIDLWPPYPGFSAAFACDLRSQATVEVRLDLTELERAARDSEPQLRASLVVDQYLRAIARIKRGDTPVDVVVCLVPDLVYQNCRPRSAVSPGVGHRLPSWERRLRSRGQLGLFDDTDPSVFSYSPDFRRQIKARSMEHEIPIQIIRESTLRTEEPQNTWGLRHLTPLADRAWNLSVALYYKSGGKPWRLSTARPGVCYVGLAYRRRDEGGMGRSATCAAQLFLDSGDGIVFMGDDGPWYSPTRRDFHLDRGAATRLLSGVLDTYRVLEGQPLTELFIHSRSGMNDEEFAGFRDAAPHGVTLTGIRVRQEMREARLFREGTRPVIRGSFWRTADDAGYLWTNGFKPRLMTYDGPEIPAPLRLEVQHGEAQIERVARDILGLTKLNYNACRLGESEPVTVGFSDAVGEILVANPNVPKHSPKFKFYI
jgi:hypothetical protein